MYFDGEIWSLTESVMASYLYPKKKYEIERLLERATIGLQAEHPECDGVSFGEVKKRDHPTSPRDTWTAAVTGGTEIGRKIFRNALTFMVKTNELVD